MHSLCRLIDLSTTTQLLDETIHLSENVEDGLARRQSFLRRLNHGYQHLP